ncbi:hypothetical protein K439DRAFT_813073 [Ramaria rubella]|nr:hypothetical protein K439DRAFT_813073 [Ramaria rubella]
MKPQIRFLAYVHCTVTSKLKQTELQTQSVFTEQLRQATDPQVVQWLHLKVHYIHRRCKLPSHMVDRR